MGDKYYPQKYQCKACSKIEKYYVWLSEIKTAEHACTCGGVIAAGDIYFEAESNSPAIKTSTKNRFYSGTTGKKEILEKYLHKPSLDKSIDQLIN
jgi:PHP family Zn ribbon phosphoesterase